MQMKIVISTPYRAWLTDLPDVISTGERVVRLTLKHADLEFDQIEVGVTLTDNVEMRSLNRDYRQQNEATNVLSFSGHDFKGPRLPGPVLLGDIVLAHGVVYEEAKQQGKRLHEHYCHLLVHGTLHLLGLDHEDREQAAKMEAAEISILARFGIANPYEHCLKNIDR